VPDAVDVAQVAGQQHQQRHEQPFPFGVGQGRKVARAVAAPKHEPHHAQADDDGQNEPRGLQALQEVGYATPISGTMGDQLDLVLECAADWEDEGRRVFSKRSSGIQLDELLAFAAQAQARSHRQLKLLQVREIKVWRD